MVNKLETLFILHPVVTTSLLILPPPSLSNYIISFMQYPLLLSSLSFVTLCIGVMLVFVTQGGGRESKTNATSIKLNEMMIYNFNKI